MPSSVQMQGDDGDRWSLAWAGRAATADRLGDHAAARYRHFRRFVERQQSELQLGPALFALLLSAESMRDELRAYEEQRSALARLAQTGHVVRQLQRLHGVLDAASASYRLKEAPGLKRWQAALADERAARAKRYRRLLARLRGDDGRAEQMRARAAVQADVATDRAQEETLTLLAAAVRRYGRDVLTAEERCVTHAAFDLAAQLAGAVVPTLPEWFAAPFEFGGGGAGAGLSRWGNDLHEPAHADAERLVAEAGTWARLHHPHVAKFLGACHVGARLFLAHEQVRLLSAYAAEVRDRAKVWRRLYEIALGLRYLHERGLACQQLDVSSAYCAKLEAKAVLLGVGLVELEDGSGARDSSQTTDRAPWSDADADRAFWRAQFIAADVMALGVLVLNVLLEADTPCDGASRYQELPKTRPGFMTEPEWRVVQQIRAAAANDVAGGMLRVINCMGEFVGVDQRDWLREAGFQDELDEVDASSDLGALELPMAGASIADVLAQCQALSKTDDLAESVNARIQDTFSQLQALGMARSGAATVKQAVAHFSCVLARFYEFLTRKQRRGASMSSQFSCSYASYASNALAASRKDPPQVFKLHVDVDRVLKEYGLDRSRAAHSWEPHWAEQCAQLETATLSALVRPPATAVHQDSAISSSPQADSDAEMLAEAELGQLTGRVGGFASGGAMPGALGRLKLPRWFIPPTEVDVHAGVELGRGSFGSVHSGKWFDTPVVVKRVFVDPSQPEAVRAQFRHEADVWFQLNHINVVKLYGACHVGDPFFVCEHASGGTVDAYLGRKHRDAYLVWYSLLNAALGLQYLHDSGVVHGDLKANNILVGADDVVKLADFGLSTSASGDQAGSHTGGALGAYRWKAPECLSGAPATAASDVYSFAMVMIELATGVVPWGPQLDDAVVKYRVTRGELPLRPGEIADDEWRLIRRMCCLDATARVTIDSVVIHLMSLVEKLDARRRRSPNAEPVASKPFKNRVLSRGGALLSLLSVMKSSNKRLAALAADHLLTVHMNRGARSERREIEGLVAMLAPRGTAAEKLWAAAALETLSSENEGNRALIVAAGGIEALVDLVRGGTNRLKAKAAAALRALAVSADNRPAVAAAGGIAPLVDMLRAGTRRQKTEAASALRILAANADIKALIASAGGIEPLVALARDGTEQQKEEAVGALLRMATTARNRALITAAGGAAALVRSVVDGWDSLKENAAGALRLLATDADGSAAIAAAGGIKPLVALLADKTTDEQKEQASGALRKLARGAAYKARIASAGAVELLVALARSGTAELKEQAAGALRLLALSDRVAASIVAAGGVDPLVGLARSGTGGQQEQAVGALRNLAGHADGRARIAAAGGVALLVRLVRRGTDAQKEAAAAALRSLAASDKLAAEIAASGGVAPLVALLRDGSDGQREHALGALRSLSVDARGKEQVAGAAGAIPALVALSKAGGDSQRTGAAAVMRSLAMLAASRAAIAQAGGVDALVALASVGTAEQKEQAASALRNLAADTDVRARIAGLGGVDALVALVRSGTSRQVEAAVGALRSVALDRGLRASIAASGGVEALSMLLERGPARTKEQAAGALWMLLLGADASVLRGANAAAGPLVALVKEASGRGRESAAGALRCLSTQKEGRAEVAAAGGVGVLVALARMGTDAQREQAAGALQALAADAELAAAITCAGGIDALVALLRSSSSMQMEHAAGALRLLARSEAAKAEVAAAGGIPLLVELVRGGSRRQQLEAAGALEQLAAVKANKVAIAAAGGVRPLVALLRRGDGSDAHQERVVGALEQLASSDQNAFMIAAAGAVKPLVALLRSRSSRLQERAAGALGRLAANPRNIQAIARAGGVDALADLLASGSDAQQAKAAAALRNLGVTQCAVASQALAADAWRRD